VTCPDNTVTVRASAAPTGHQRLHQIVDLVGEHAERTDNADLIALVFPSATGCNRCGNSMRAAATARWRDSMAPPADTHDPPHKPAMPVWSIRAYRPRGVLGAGRQGHRRCRVMRGSARFLSGPTVSPIRPSMRRTSSVGVSSVSGMTYTVVQSSVFAVLPRCCARRACRPTVVDPTYRTRPDQAQTTYTARRASTGTAGPNGCGPLGPAGWTRSPAYAASDIRRAGVTRGPRRRRRLRSRRRPIRRPPHPGRRRIRRAILRYEQLRCAWCGGCGAPRCGPRTRDR
jgi:hypothetical protein